MLKLQPVRASLPLIKFHLCGRQQHWHIRRASVNLFRNLSRQSFWVIISKLCPKTPPLSAGSSSAEPGAGSCASGCRERQAFTLGEEAAAVSLFSTSRSSPACNNTATIEQCRLKLITGGDCRTWAQAQKSARFEIIGGEDHNKLVTSTLTSQSTQHRGSSSPPFLALQNSPLACKAGTVGRRRCECAACLRVVGRPHQLVQACLITEKTNLRYGGGNLFGTNAFCVPTTSLVSQSGNSLCSTCEAQASKPSRSPSEPGSAPPAASR